ncbi:hypothetical protein DsansV1_C10g0097641 [Dioscorea sansibarensis]
MRSVTLIYVSWWNARITKFERFVPQSLYHCKTAFGGNNLRSILLGAVAFLCLQKNDGASESRYRTFLC